jgi:hypothetical protein
VQGPEAEGREGVETGEEGGGQREGAARPVEGQANEAGAAQALAATAAARRERAKASERARATFAALPGEEERRLRRIKHNLRLIRVLVLRPAEHLAAKAEALVVWQSPGVSGAVLAVLQALVLHDCLRYLPAVLLLACAAQVMEVQRTRREGAAGTSLYTVEYYYPQSNSLRERARRIDKLTAKADQVVQGILICFLKIHSAFASVDNALSLRFAVGLGLLGAGCAFVAVFFGIVPVWLVLSPAITIGFAVRHPMVAMLVWRVQPAGMEDAGAARAVLAVLWGGAALVPLWLTCPWRSSASAGVSVLVLAGLRYKQARDAQAEGNNQMTAPTLVWLEIHRQVRELWELLPSPAIRNTAEGEPCDEAD